MENLEIWKTLSLCEDYEVSNLGRVKSLKYNREKILKQSIGTKGYLVVSISYNGKIKVSRVHLLIAKEFLNHVSDGTNKLVVNHIDLNKENNRADNLEIVTNRINCNFKHIPHTSKYTGVSWCKQTNKWRANIYVNKKNKSLGRHESELYAHLAYENELKLISLQNEYPQK